MSKYPQMKPWPAGGDDFLFGCDAPLDADETERMKAFLWEEGYTLDVLTPDERLRLHSCLLFVPLYSVLKRDLDELGDEADPGGWHTAGSGKRRRDCWWVERIPFTDLIDDITERIQANCPHTEPHESGYWCKACGIALRALAVREEQERE